MNHVHVYIETYGCQMNKLDSELVQSLLEADGFQTVSDIAHAEVILLNTCGVRENAEQRVRGRLTELLRLKKNRPNLFFGVIGCMAQRLGDELFSETVRIVAGPDSYRQLPGMIRHAFTDTVINTDSDHGETYGGISPVRSSPVSAWVAVMRGCNNFCSYCIVPYTRGRERSRPAADIIQEVAELRKNGWREITLLGQNVNSYRDSSLDFAGLLRQVSDTGIDWIRFLTSHPKDLTKGILEIMSERENICNHLHLPLQSGSDRILEAMNRGYTVAEYLSLIDRARELIKGISITTDLIFGFPGESEQDFRATLALMERTRFDYSFLYRYSEREGTKACLLSGEVPEEQRISRLREAITLQNEITVQKNTDYIGREIRILVKDRSKDGSGWLGFTEASIPVVVNSGQNDDAVGSFVRVLVESTTGASLVGRIL